VTIEILPDLADTAITNPVARILPPEDWA
jgi:hypothetical protein